MTLQAVTLLLALLPVDGKNEVQGIELFEDWIRPMLVQHCCAGVTARPHNSGRRLPR
jgi:hypothetical protein